MRTAVVGLVVLLVAALPAGAQDRCLTGASTLPDQRDLAALRTATETACPCASAVARSDYQKCAKIELSAALAAGDLRSECKRTATRTNKGAVCGSTKIACGRYTPTSSSKPLTCRLKDAAKCEDGSKFESNACTAETHCADVVDWTASTCVDVRDFGPYAPGVRIMTFTSRPSRRTARAGRWLRRAAARRGVRVQRRRRLRERRVRDPDAHARRRRSGIRRRPAPGRSTPSTGGVLDAPLDLTARPLPILLFSHGSCGFPLQSKFLTALVASYGFIVAAPPHPGNRITDPGADPRRRRWRRSSSGRRT